MQLLQVAADSFVIVRTPAGAVPIYSVAPIVGGLPGRRSFSLNTDASGVGCYFKSFYVQGQDAQSAALRVELGTIYNVSSVKLQKKVGTVYKDMSEQMPVQLSLLFRDSALISGYNFYRVVALLANGQEVIGDSLAVFHFNNMPVALYPNPVKQGTVLNLQSELPGKYDIWVYDINGRLVHTQQLQEVTNTITVQWPSGMYLVRIGGSDGVWGTAKVIVY
jgi:hypothetical protein